MKIDRSEIAPSGKRRLCVYLGDEDLEIIDGMCQSVIQHTPPITSTFKLRQRVQNMRHDIRAFWKSEQEERAAWVS